MHSVIADHLQLSHAPVAILRTSHKPEQAMQFKPGKWGCVMFLFAGAARGRTAVLDAETYGCWGGGVGMGFGNTYRQFPGGLDAFAAFLSSGNRHTEQGRALGNKLQSAAGAEFADNFLNGECFRKNPELVLRWMEELPIREPSQPFVVFQPLDEVAASETPDVVVMTVTPDQLSALVILANYGRPGRDNVLIPWAAGCQLVGLLPFHEQDREFPRAVVGLTDISARNATRKLLGADVLTFAMPWKLFLEMEANVPGSFLERPAFSRMMGC